MSGPSFRRSRRSKTEVIDWVNTPVVPVKTYVPKSAHALIEAKARQLNLPMSILILRAIMNEVECAAPFHEDYSLANPDAPLDLEKVAVLIEYMKKQPGLSLDHLISLRRDIGISKDDLLLAYGYLCDRGNIKIETSKYKYSKLFFVQNGRPNTNFDGPIPLIDVDHRARGGR